MNPNPTPAAAPEQPDPLAELAELLTCRALDHMDANAVEGFRDGRFQADADGLIRQCFQATIAALRESPSPAMLKHYKQAAKEIGELFCWCIENLKRFPPIEGDWIDELKKRLRDAESAITAAQQSSAQLRTEIESEVEARVLANMHALERQREAAEQECERLKGEVYSAKSVIWTCGCGWNNGVNLAACAQCGRTVSEACATQYDSSVVRAEAAEQECERLKKEPTWDTSPLDDESLLWIAHAIDHSLRWDGVEVGELKVRWNNRTAGMLLKTIGHYQQEAATAKAKRDSLRAALEQIAKAPTFIQGGDGISGPCVWCEMSATKLVAEEAIEKLSLSHSPTGQE